MSGRSAKYGTLIFEIAGKTRAGVEKQSQDLREETSRMR